MVLAAIVQFGIAYNHYLQLTDAVRAGSRVASVTAASAGNGPATCTAVQTAMQAAAANLGLACNRSLTVSSTPTWASGSNVTVAATYVNTFSIFGVSVLHVPLQSSMTERIE